MSKYNFINIPDKKINEIVNNFEIKGYAKLDKIIT